MISGGIKFFQRSKCLLEDGASIVASSGDASADRCLDRNPVSYYRSVGSTDMTNETLEITFDSMKTFSRILLLDHNFKEFSVKYDVAGVWTDFANVVDLDGSQATISETVYSKDTAYYEFDSVTTGKILISVLKTQVVDAEKYLNQVIVTNEIGTLQGYPQIRNIGLDRNIRNEKMLSGRVLSMKSDEFFKVGLDFKDYPASLSDDIDLIFSLHDIEEPFLIWLCGGKYGSNYFRKQARGYRLRDVIAVQLIAPLAPIYSDNVYVNSLNFSASFQEAVG